jgi:hypothetical protein
MTNNMDKAEDNPFASLAKIIGEANSRSGKKTDARILGSAQNEAPGATAPFSSECLLFKITNKCQTLRSAREMEGNGCMREFGI